MNLEVVSATAMAIAGVPAAGIWSGLRCRKRRQEAEFERHSFTPEQLMQALARDPQLPLFDLCEPLDVLADSAIIPGARRLSPSKVLENPWLLPKERLVVIYCASPNDETSRIILRRALSMGFLKVRLLKGGIEAWKSQGFPVKSESSSMRLDLAS